MRPANARPAELHRNRRGGIPLSRKELVTGVLSLVIGAVIITHTAVAPRVTAKAVAIHTLDSRLVVETLTRPA